MIATVTMWGRRIGAVEQPDAQSVATFQYDPAFIQSGIEVSPIVMPLRSTPYRFPAIEPETFHFLPGLLADSLPDRFGSALIDAWLATRGRDARSFSAVERLCYVGSRGMGALEYEPETGPDRSVSHILHVDDLVALASDILSQRSSLTANLAQSPSSLADLLHVGTSAGGARAKAVIAWNPKTSEIRSGQIDYGSGFEHWMIKFDGVANNRDKEMADPSGFGKIEYAYSLMAREAGIEMSECRLWVENGRSHFLTKRFDRKENGSKLHMQSLGALAHLDFNQAGVHSYEQAFFVCRQLSLPTMATEQLFRRMLFNVVARNQDDHVKNIAFLMNNSGVWSLAPAFDVVYSFNPDGLWTSKHQMTINGQRDNFSIADIEQAGSAAHLKKNRSMEILSEVTEAVRKWPAFAEQATVSDEQADAIERSHRLKLS